AKRLRPAFRLSQIPLDLDVDYVVTVSATVGTTNSSAAVVTKEIARVLDRDFLLALPDRRKPETRTGNEHLAPDRRQKRRVPERGPAASLVVIDEEDDALSDERGTRAGSPYLLFHALIPQIVRRRLNLGGQACIAHR